MNWSVKLIVALVLFILAWVIAIMQGSALAPMFLLVTVIVILLLPIP